MELSISFKRITKEANEPLLDQCRNVAWILTPVIWAAQQTTLQKDAFFAV
jgi:hypothetical protein